MAQNNCCWVIVPNSPGVTAVYCNKPVKYKMKQDDDGNSVRKYESFCPTHKEIADSQEEESY